MKLIEKKCPNCGASLSFTIEDTSCKCEYCKREYEIERDVNIKKLADQFNLSELKTPFKVFSYFTIGSFIAQAAIFIIGVLIIVIIAFNIVKGFNDSDSIFNRNANLVTNFKDLSKDDYSTMDLNSEIVFSKETIGKTSNYVKKGKLKREKVYIISNDKSNYIISVYKVVFENFFNDSKEKYTLYVPIQYKNVKKKNNSISFYLNNGDISSKEYCFEDNECTYGYDNLEVLYDEVIKQYEKDYKIVEK